MTDKAEIMSLLQAVNLTVNAPHRPILEGVSFEVQKGSIATVLGSSGCGKSTLLKALCGLTDRHLTVTADRLEFDGLDLCDKKQRRRCIGRSLNLILQNPRAYFDERFTFGQSAIEYAKALGLTCLKELEDQMCATLSSLSLAYPQRLWRSYPQDFSDGMLVRAALALMLLSKPKLLILDEATAPLDAAVKSKTVAFLKDLRQRCDLSILMVTHELNVAVHMSDSIYLLDEGKLAFEGTVTEFKQNDLFVLKPYQDYLQECGFE